LQPLSREFRADLTFRTRKQIVWDAKKERVLHDHEANQLVLCFYRKPWKLPYAT
jgi:hypothetical protein